MSSLRILFVYYSECCMGSTHYTPLQRYNAVLTALALPVICALRLLATTYSLFLMSTSIYETILNSFSPSLHSVNHCHTERSQSKTIAMTREAAQIGDDEKRDSCSTCQDLAFRDESWTPFHTTRERSFVWKVEASCDLLRLSSREGCPSCDLLYQFSKIVLKDIPDSKPELVTSKYDWDWEASELRISMEHGDTNTKRSFPLYVTKGQSACDKNHACT